YTPVSGGCVPRRSAVSCQVAGSYGSWPSSIARAPAQTPEKSLRCRISARRSTKPNATITTTPSASPKRNAASSRRSLIRSLDAARHVPEVARRDNLQAIPIKHRANQRRRPAQTLELRRTIEGVEWDVGDDEREGTLPHPRRHLIGYRAAGHEARPQEQVIDDRLGPVRDQHAAIFRQHRCTAR